MIQLKTGDEWQGNHLRGGCSHCPSNRNNHDMKGMERSHQIQELMLKNGTRYGDQQDERNEGGGRVNDYAGRK